MKIKDRLIKILVATSLLCGCSSNVAFSSETLIFKQPTQTQTVVLTTEVISETWTEGSMPEMVYADYKEGMGGIKWIASYVEGKLKTITEDYVITYDEDGNMISKTAVIGSRVVQEAVAPKMQFGGSVSVGSEFFPQMVTYGVDCAGCKLTSSGVGGTSAGVKLSKTAVKQPNGEWKDGIKYGDYYIVAADPNIPLCSIITIYDHGFSGEGLTPGVPFQAIVLDRGGSVKGALLDLFKGSEKSKNVKNNRNVTIKAVITRVGGKSGTNACKL